MLDHKGTCVIFTKRLTLRKFSNADVTDTYNNWANDVNVIPNIDSDMHTSKNATETFILNTITNYSKDFYCWNIILNETNDSIGSIQFLNINEYTKRCEVGFVLGSKYWNKGLMTEALKKILEFGLYTVGFVRIEGYCKSENIPSIKLMKKSNMSFEGLLKKAILLNDIFYDGELYAIVNQNI